MVTPEKGKELSGRRKMTVPFLYDREVIFLRVPRNALLYESSFPEPPTTDAEVVMDAVYHPSGSLPLKGLLEKRRPGEVVVAVSDITRPIPYSRFLPSLLALIESAGVRREEIILLIATGMHRPSTPTERLEMFGREVMERFRIIDHNPEEAANLIVLPGRSWSGNSVRLNRRFVEAGFRMITGLVEPHFMAGFSGGRKTICPGLCDLATIRQFHGAEFLSDPRACNGCLDGNPCHEEALSIARLASVDFSLNLVLNRNRRVVRAFAGHLECAHEEACRFVAQHACIKVSQPADLVLTSCGGYPLDTTFYQCVKGFLGCLPAVKQSGCIIAFGGCSEGIGSPEYEALMRKYSRNWRDFLRDLRVPGSFVKDQWEFQMQTRALEKVGREKLLFVSHGLSTETLNELSVTGIGVKRSQVAHVLQSLVDREATAGSTVAVFPEGPYCVAV